MKETRYRLHMVIGKNGKRSVLIGYFPSLYRARTTASRLDWTSAWVTVITDTMPRKMEAR